MSTAASVHVVRHGCIIHGSSPEWARPKSCTHNLTTDSISPLIQANASPAAPAIAAQALATAARMALENGGALTLLVIDEPGTTGRDPKTRLETLSWHMREQGVTE